MTDPNTPVWWRLHLRSTPKAVYQMLSTDAGRAQFWAESAVEQAGYINFIFPGGDQWRGKILTANPPHQFRVEYLDHSLTTFNLTDDGEGGTELLLTDENVPPQHQSEVIAGWVSVLMALKAAVDFQIDLRNHHPNRTYRQGYADN